MLIGISGKSQSGKSTVAKIMQWLIAEDDRDSKKFLYDDDWRYDQSDKLEIKNLPEVLDNYIENKWWLEEVSKFEIKSFSTPLKQMYCNFKGISLKEFNQNKELHRLELIALGDRIREWNQDAFVNALFKDYKKENFIIDDLRFLNEAQAVLDRGGVCIRVEKEELNNSYKIGEIPSLPHFKCTKALNLGIIDTPRKEYIAHSYHISETQLDDFKHFKYTIYNNLSLENLVEQVKVILKKENLI